MISKISFPPRRELDVLGLGAPEATRLQDGVTQAILGDVVTYWHQDGEQARQDQAGQVKQSIGR